MLNLKQEVKNFLEKNDYVTCEYRGCFDIIAKKEMLLFLKVLLNVDAFQKKQARNLKIITNNLDGYPMLIGLQTNREKLKAGIVYERFELPTLSLKTFEELIENKIFPKIYRDKGGLYVEIDSEILREARKNKNLTQRELAEAVGINKKVIYEHEKKQLRMLIDIAEKIENILNEEIIKPVKIFKKYEVCGEPRDSIEKDVALSLEKIGFKTDFVKQSPLDVFVKEKLLIASEIEVNKKRLIKRAADLKKFINFVKKPALLITEKAKDKEMLGIPLIERKELEEIEKKELIKRAKKAL
ncbi:MAG: helix-turn-helix domain-containing protein [Candidatus Aenigmatarchaeota archaeon]